MRLVRAWRVLFVVIPVHWPVHQRRVSGSEVRQRTARWIRTGRGLRSPFIRVSAVPSGRAVHKRLCLPGWPVRFGSVRVPDPRHDPQPDHRRGWRVECWGGPRLGCQHWPQSGMPAGKRNMRRPLRPMPCWNQVPGLQRLCRGAALLCQPVHRVVRGSVRRIGVCAVPARADGQIRRRMRLRYVERSDR